MDSSIKYKIPLRIRKYLEERSHEISSIIEITNSDDTIFKLSDKALGSNFHLSYGYNRNQNHHYVSFTPSNEDNMEGTYQRIDKTPSLIPYIELCLDLIKEYNKQSPLFDKPIDNFSKINFDDTREFNQDEKQQVKLALNQSKSAYQSNLELTKSEFNILNEKIDYLAESVDRLNKIDWKNIAIGILTSTISSLALTPENGSYIWSTLINYLKGAFPYLK